MPVPVAADVMSIVIKIAEAIEAGVIQVDQGSQPLLADGLAKDESGLQAAGSIRQLWRASRDGCIAGAKNVVVMGKRETDLRAKNHAFLNRNLGMRRCTEHHTRTNEKWHQVLAAQRRQARA